MIFFVLILSVFPVRKCLEKDEQRTAFLKEYGLTVIRIPNNEVNRNFEGVCKYIDAAVRQSLSQLR